MPLFIADLSFLFLLSHFEFETEIFGGCTNICGEHPQFFLEFFDTFKNNFFDGSICSMGRHGSTRYFLAIRAGALSSSSGRTTS